MVIEADILAEQAEKLQHEASDPTVSAWVSASAGSGKTKVLIDRILRLLLSGEEAEKILCLTYTKAAAAEMKNRLTQTLRKWVLADDEKLEKELEKLMGDKIQNKQELMDFARTLFARILEVKGGFKMMTIHAFCESLLRRFPLEAGVSPSFEIIDDTERPLLLKNAMLRTFEKTEYAQDLLILSEYVSEKNLLSLLCEIQKQQDKIEQLLNYMSFESVKDKIYATLGVSENDREEWQRLREELSEKAESEKDKKQKKVIEQKIQEVSDKIKALDVAKSTCSLMYIILDVFRQFNLNKQNRGVLDYSDLIEKTATLLHNSEATAWVLYKLDGGIDHILLDEAQDTSPEQWKIIRSIAEEFFSGLGWRGDKIRTLFVVGDKKQSIYRFQGADAKEFEKMHEFFAQKIPQSDHVFKDIRLNISFRSVQPVLDLVNSLLQKPVARRGVAKTDENIEHLAYRAGFSGQVEVWPLEFIEESKQEVNVWQTDDFTQVETPAVKKLSQKIALRIRKMLDDKEILPSVNRPIKPSDIMILLRSRNRQGITEELIKALKEQKIPVSGIDRLILNKHIVIQDLMSLGAFLLLPDDDLSLAEVLKSPIFSLNEDELLNLCVDRDDKTLWANIVVKNEKIYKILKDLLSKVDVLNPFELFSYILDVLGYRRNFLAYFGKETNEMIDEFLNLCLTFERNNVPSLEAFLQFMKKGKVEIKRDMDSSEIDAVRIMTVHASKGLQSKIVFLPDAYSKKTHTTNFFWKDGLPIWVPVADMRPELCNHLLDEFKSEENDEYNRLLYVALTRAEDRLYVCGFKTLRKANADNWYDMITDSLPSYTSEKGAILMCSQTVSPKKEKQKEENLPLLDKLPDWFDKVMPVEPVPTKPISPSKLTDDPAAPSPLTPEQEKAMERGSFIHKLLQFLPDLPAADRKEFVLKNTPKEMKLPKNLLNLFDDVRFVDLFSPNSLAEVPVVGTTQDGKIICGQIDRLVIKENEVLIVDYKTNRYPPKLGENIPLAYIEQINAYKDLLKGIFPGKNIKGFLLWTTNLTFMEI